MYRIKCCLDAVGFVPPHDQTVTVSESAGTVDIIVGLTSGKLCGQVEVGYSDEAANATGEASSLMDSQLLNIDHHAAGEDYDLSADSLLILSTQYPNDTIVIFIQDDNITECMESFSIYLNFPGGPFPRLTLNSSTTTVIILDDDKSK